MGKEAQSSKEARSSREAQSSAETLDLQATNTATESALKESALKEPCTVPVVRVSASESAEYFSGRPEVAILEVDETVTDSDYRTICMPCLPIEESLPPRYRFHQRGGEDDREDRACLA